MNANEIILVTTIVSLLLALSGYLSHNITQRKRMAARVHAHRNTLRKVYDTLKSILLALPHDERPDNSWLEHIPEIDSQLIALEKKLSGGWWIPNPFLHSLESEVESAAAMTSDLLDHADKIKNQIELKEEIEHAPPVQPRSGAH